MPVHYGLITAHDAKVAGTASAITAVMMQFPSMTKKAATGIVRGIGWQGALLLYGIQTNPQRPRDIPGPINIGFTPSEQRVGEAISRGIQYLRDVERQQPMVQPYPGMVGQAPLLDFPPPTERRKRKQSKFGKAVKAGMQWLKRGGKGATGAPKGRYPAGAFSKATKAAGLASPTKSKIGKGKTVIKKLARVLKAKYYHGPAATKYLKTKKRPSL